MIMQIFKSSFVKIVLVMSSILLVGVTIAQTQTIKSNQADQSVSKLTHNSVEEKKNQNSNQNNDDNIGNKSSIFVKFMPTCMMSMGCLVLV